MWNTAINTPGGDSPSITRRDFLKVATAGAISSPLAFTYGYLKDQKNSTPVNDSNIYSPEKYQALVNSVDSGINPIKVMEVKIASIEDTAENQDTLSMLKNLKTRMEKEIKSGELDRKEAVLITQMPTPFEQGFFSGKDNGELEQARSNIFRFHINEEVISLENFPREDLKKTIHKS